MSMSGHKKYEKIKLKDAAKSLKYLPRFFGQVWHSSPAMFASNIGSRLLAAVIPVVMLWLGKLIVDEIVTLQGAEVRDMTMLWYYIGAELILVIVTSVLSRVISLTDGLLGDKYSYATSIALIQKSSELQLAQLEDSEIYDKLERARRQTINRIVLLSGLLTQGQDLIMVISLLGGLIYFEPWLILLLLLSVVPSILNELKFSGTSYSLVRSWTQERREMDYLRYAGASDVTAKEVKLFGLADYLSERFKKLADTYYIANKKLAVDRTVWGLVFSTLGTAAYYGAYVLIALRTVAGILTLGDLTFLSSSFSRLSSNMASLFTRFASMTESAMYLQDYFEFLDLNIEQEDKEYLPMPADVRKGFRFENVGFKYPGSDQWVMRGLSFELRAGEKLALVGENGAGKTTLIKLLLRFYDPTEGTIYMDGVDVAEYDRAEYQKMFGVIFQDFVKYDLSLKENIAVGKIDEIENTPRIDAAVEKSLANEVRDILPAGYEQQLGKRFRSGTELSGGQWQKIALARAYMKDAEVLILDEPTSALDARAEYEAFQRFIGLTESKTSVIISHRFSTVRMADRILVLQDGQMLEHGTHDELMRNDQLYSELFSLQAAGYQ